MEDIKDNIELDILAILKSEHIEEISNVPGFFQDEKINAKLIIPVGSVFVSMEDGVTKARQVRTKKFDTPEELKEEFTGKIAYVYKVWKKENLEANTIKYAVRYTLFGDE